MKGYLTARCTGPGHGLWWLAFEGLRKGAPGPVNGGVRLEDTKVGFKHGFFFKGISCVSAFVVCRPPGVLLSKQELSPAVSRGQAALPGRLKETARNIGTCLKPYALWLCIFTKPGLGGPINELKGACLRKCGPSILTARFSGPRRASRALLRGLSSRLRSAANEAWDR